MNEHARRPLTSEECSGLLGALTWGVVAVAEPASGNAATPVAVPMAYAYDDARIFMTMTDGRKLRALSRNPRLCLTVADVQSLHQWRSAMVIGRPRWLTAERARREAIAAFRAHARRAGAPLTRGDTARFAHARILALEVLEMHGFASGPGVDAHAEADAPLAAMEFLRRVVRSLRAERAHAESAHGVTPAQLFVLREIAKAGTATVGELSQRTATGQSSVSDVVSRLVERGLVSRTRSRTDGRRAELALSRSGRAMIAHAPETVPELLLAAFRRLPAAQQRRTADGLRQWIAEAGLSGVDATMLFEPLDDQRA